MSAFASTIARILFATLTLTASGVQAQAHVSRMADLNTGPNQFTRSSMIAEGAVRFDGRMLFSATTDRTGRELWVSNGTPQGTRLLLDFCPGRCDGLPLNPQFTLVDGDSMAICVFQPATAFMALSFGAGAMAKTRRTCSSTSIKARRVPRRGCWHRARS